MSPKQTASPKDEPASTGSSQPPPPEFGGSGETLPWSPKSGHGPANIEAAEAIYGQLIEVRKIVNQLLQESAQARTRRRLELVPVRTSDLMRGFQAAVARANRATRAGEGDSEDIERMAIKDLEISVTAPLIESAHAEDPVLMLPNLKSVDADSPAITLKFNVVSVPRAQRG